LNRRLAALLGADERATDAGRILRVPDTLNHKSQPPAPVRLLELDPARIYSVEQLEAHLPDEPRAGVREWRSRRPAAPSAPVQRVLDRLEGVVEGANGWTALCPVHGDENPSLSVAEGHDGLCLINCHAGCTPEDIVGKLGLEMSDLFPGSKRRRRRASSELVGLAERAGLELFATPAGRPHAMVAVDGHRETWPLRSGAVELWLRRLEFERSGEPVGGEVVAEALATFEARALFDGEQREVFRRVAGVDGRVVIDLGDRAWRTIEVSPSAGGCSTARRPRSYAIRARCRCRSRLGAVRLRSCAGSSTAPTSAAGCCWSGRC
jgi:hypothetical protein